MADPLPEDVAALCDHAGLDSSRYKDFTTLRNAVAASSRTVTTHAASNGESPPAADRRHRPFALWDCHHTLRRQQTELAAAGLRCHPYRRSLAPGVEPAQGWFQKIAATPLSLRRPAEIQTPNWASVGERVSQFVPVLRRGTGTTWRTFAGEGRSPTGTTGMVEVAAMHSSELPIVPSLFVPDDR